MFRDFVSSYRKGLEACYDELPVEKLEKIVDILLDAQQKGRKVFILGNGGSASTASHMAVDHGKGAALPGKPRLRALSLSDNAGLITAWANDASYEVVFKEQLETLLDPGDVVIAISASGNSPNVLQAVEYAREHNAVTIGLIGFGGGRLKDLVHIDITTSSRNYGQIEDFHLSLNHIMSQYLREQIRLQPGFEHPRAEKFSFFYSNPPASGTRPAIFLDRDGVINEQIADGYVTRWGQFRFVEGIPEVIAKLSQLELPIIVVSNQAGVAKGVVARSTLNEITDSFVASLKTAGARIDAVYYCPHSEHQKCECRKPRPGLLNQAAHDWKLDLNRSVLIGDSDRDLAAAQSIGCRAILLKTNGATWQHRFAEGTIKAERAADIVDAVYGLFRPAVQENATALFRPVA